MMPTNALIVRGITPAYAGKSHLGVIAVMPG